MRHFLTIAILLICVCQNCVAVHALQRGSSGSEAAVGQHQQPLHVPCVRAVDWARWCATVKSLYGSQLPLNIRTATGGSWIEPLDGRPGSAPSPTLQSQLVRLQV